jgi:hypothetical protein
VVSASMASDHSSNAAGGMAAGRTIGESSSSRATSAAGPS